MNWRNFYPIIFIFCLIDGFFSNVFYTSVMPLLIKDFYILFVFILFLFSEHWITWAEGIQQLDKTVTIPAAFFFFWAVLQIFNPYSPGAQLGLLGLKIYFLPWVLIPMTYIYIDSFKKASFLLKTIVLTAIPVNLFGIYQFINGPSFLISRYGYGFQRAFFEAALEQHSGNIKSFCRIIATFASTGQYSAFLLFNTLFSISLIFMSNDKKAKLLWSASAFLSFIAMLMTGSRGYLLTLILALGLFSLFSKRPAVKMAVTLFVALNLVIGLLGLGKGVWARIHTIGDTKVFKERTVHTTGKMFIESLDKYPLGRGIGSVSSAARHLKIQGPKTGLGSFVENYVAKLQIETGAPGILLFSLMLFFLIKNWFDRWLIDNDSLAVAALSAAAISFIFLNFFFGILDTPPGYLFLCLVIGMVGKLVALNYSYSDQTIFEDSIDTPPTPNP